MRIIARAHRTSTEAASVGRRRRGGRILWNFLSRTCVLAGYTRAGTSLRAACRAGSLIDPLLYDPPAFTTFTRSFVSA